MNKNNFTAIALETGEVHVYDFGAVKLHAYRTDDPLADEVFLVEKNGQAVIIESPCFKDSVTAFAKYASRFTVAGMLIAYHMAGGTLLPEARKFATQNAVDYGTNGGGKALIDNFTNVFGGAFDGTLHTVTDVVPEGRLTLGGIDFVLVKTHEAFDVEIPEINAVYTHMLGHDCHSIVAGAAHADAIIAQLKGYLERKVSLVLTSHYTPEDLKDAQMKIDYLEEIKKIAAACTTADEFKAAVGKRFPEYGGANYLDMTAQMFFA